jgi:hypothetical protein
MRRARLAALAVVALAVALWPAAASLQQAEGAAAAFEITAAMIPMRDGVKLHTRVFVPRQGQEPLPILLLRTPYGIASAERKLVTQLKALADDGYVFAFQDIRGKYGSEGQFVMQRPARDPGDTKALDEGTDTWDTIEWLLVHTKRHNGRVGMLGVSYDGWTTIMGALELHPALRVPAQSERERQALAGEGVGQVRAPVVGELVGRRIAVEAAAGGRGVEARLHLVARVDAVVDLRRLAVAGPELELVAAAPGVREPAAVEAERVLRPLLEVPVGRATRLAVDRVPDPLVRLQPALGLEAEARAVVGGLRAQEEARAEGVAPLELAEPVRVARAVATLVPQRAVELGGSHCGIRPCGTSVWRRTISPVPSTR